MPRTVLLLSLLGLLAQPPQDPPEFSSTTELVVLHVSVVDRKDGFVAGLTRDAFTVLEDGRPQSIAFFESKETPVTVGLVIDSSGSMLRRREAVIAAGMAFAESSHPDDEMFTINFNEKVWPGLAPGRLFTSDHAELRQALHRSGARGQTALFDAVDAGLRHLDAASRPRRVLVVISDGADNASRATFDAVLDGALRRDVVIYGMGIVDRNDRDANPGVLKKLAEVTGGESFFPREIDDVLPALERIAADIRSCYTIGYVPPKTGPARGRRAVRVTVRPPDGRKLSARARSAYIRDATEAGR
jgi:VWFA-related protein